VVIASVVATILIVLIALVALAVLLLVAVLQFALGFLKAQVALKTVDEIFGTSGPGRPRNPSNGE